MNIIQKVCKELGINQAELSRMIGVSQSKISEYNSGKRETPKVVNFALGLILENKELKKDSEILDLLSKRVSKNYTISQ